ncbi:hypothetical protein EVAR_90752_1 [Eumeta japonica]|uniref:Uncharacterized protein n=1 Tax=Eumeta variegata TaxID=151549 RepID=A0A4C1ZDV6_EUMVA|nr:hypothetical protein EVAR_90752_1 [Eumeta japonica]
MLVSFLLPDEYECIAIPIHPFHHQIYLRFPHIHPCCTPTPTQSLKSLNTTILTLLSHLHSMAFTSAQNSSRSSNYILHVYLGIDMSDGQMSRQAIEEVNTSASSLAPVNVGQ